MLVSISLVTDFSNYLADDENNLRLILQKRDFNHYLYNGLGYIRHYAKDNVIVSTDILKALDLMAKSLNPRDYQSVWDFAIHTALGFENLFLFEQDSQQFYLALYNLATTTNNQKDYEKFLKKM